MHVFVTGGSGLTGPAVVAELIAAGHVVTGLARSDEAAARLRKLGAQPLPGALEDRGQLLEGAKAADGVIHLAFGGSFNDPAGLIRRDVSAIETLGQALAGSGRPFAGQGVRSSVVRLAPTVHGPGDFGFIPTLIAAARTAGVSAYPGDGANRWPAIHRLDAARLFRLALEEAPAGSALHGAGESAVTLETIAHQIGRSLRIPVTSLSQDQFSEHLGNAFLARCFAADVPASSACTRALLGWTPARAPLLEDLDTGDYFTTA